MTIHSSYFSSIFLILILSLLVMTFFSSSSL